MNATDCCGSVKKVMIYSKCISKNQSFSESSFIDFIEEVNFYEE